ncbi:glycosyltransferase family 2 protein [Pectinatus frisingensis]|uniref:glycosyltransferase family 2 protein n=1 Tax=Pectinatus frisingensis TaxID=865 RepID=UPI0018C7AFC7|nr:glycosyltransferase family 2 protein [Pectinatus frisingensis]
MNNKLKISIITVSYNAARTIEQTIQSVVNQTYDNIEYIIIDGGSTDGTVDIIKKYENKIAYWVSEPDDGIYDAMNKGLGKVTGDVIGIINSDDWYDINTVDNLIQIFRENTNVGVIYGDLIFCDYLGKTLYRGKPNIRKLHKDMTIFHPTVFFRYCLYKQYGGFSDKYIISADYEFVLRLYNKNINFYYLQNDLAYFRAGGASEKSLLLGFYEVYKISSMYACPKWKAKINYDYKIYKHKLYKMINNKYGKLFLKLYRKIKMKYKESDLSE